jgi:hypothetical protein
MTKCGLESGINVPEYGKAHLAICIDVWVETATATVRRHAQDGGGLGGIITIKPDRKLEEAKFIRRFMGTDDQGANVANIDIPTRYGEGQICRFLDLAELLGDANDGLVHDERIEPKSNVRTRSRKEGVRWTQNPSVDDARR